MTNFVLAQKVLTRSMFRKLNCKVLGRGFPFCSASCPRLNTVLDDVPVLCEPNIEERPLCEVALDSFFLHVHWLELVHVLSEVSAVIYP